MPGNERESDRPPRAAGGRLAEIVAQVKAQRYPPVDRWNPDFCGEIDIRIARDGSWHYMGTPIGRPEMVRLFASVLRRDDDGYYLVTPAEKLKIRVDDAPFLAIDMDCEGTDENRMLIFHTRTGDRVIADKEHVLRVDSDPESGEPRPGILVRGRLEARLARPVFYRLVDLAEEAIRDGRRCLEVQSAGCRFSLGEIGEAD